MSDVTTIVEKLNTAFEEYKKTQDEKIEQLKKGLEPDPLLEEKLTKVESELQALQQKYDQVTAAIRRPKNVEGGVEENTQVKMFEKMLQSNDGREHSITEDDLEQYKSAFNAFLRKGEKGLSNEEYKAITIGTGASGGYLVQPEMYNKIIEYILPISPMRQYAMVTNIGTDRLEIPRAVGGTAGGWVGESGTRAVTNTETFEQVVITAEEMYALPEASVRSLDDAVFNVEDFLSRRVARVFAQLEGQAFISGDGVDKPTGLLDATTGLANSVTSAAIGSFNVDDLIDLEATIKADYRPGAVFMLGRGAMADVRKLKDANGQYLWQPPVQAGMPSTLLGYEVVLMEHMPAVATGNAAIALVNLQEAYMIVDRHDIRVLRDPYSHKGFVQFYFAKRTGGKTVNPEAGAKLVIG